MPIPRKLADDIKKAQDSGYSADQILMGIGKSGKYPELYQKIESSKAKFNPESILKGLLSSKTIEDTPAPQSNVPQTPIAVNTETREVASRDGFGSSVSKKVPLGDPKFQWTPPERPDYDVETGIKTAPLTPSALESIQPAEELETSRDFAGAQKVARGYSRKAMAMVVEGNELLVDTLSKNPEFFTPQGIMSEEVRNKFMTDFYNEDMDISDIQDPVGRGFKLAEEMSKVLPGTLSMFSSPVVTPEFWILRSAIIYGVPPTLGAIGRGGSKLGEIIRKDIANMEKWGYERVSKASEKYVEQVTKQLSSAKNAVERWEIWRQFRHKVFGAKLAPATDIIKQQRTKIIAKAIKKILDTDYRGPTTDMIQPLQGLQTGGGASQVASKLGLNGTITDLQRIETYLAENVDKLPVKELEAVFDGLADYLAQLGDAVLSSMAKDIVLKSVEKSSKINITPEDTVIPDFKGSGEAITFGRQASPEVVEALKARKLDLEAQIEGLGADDSKLQEKLNIGVKGQLVREAVDSAEGRITPEMEVKAGVKPRDAGIESTVPLNKTRFAQVGDTEVRQISETDKNIHEQKNIKIDKHREKLSKNYGGQDYVKEAQHVLDTADNIVVELSNPDITSKHYIETQIQALKIFFKGLRVVEKEVKVSNRKNSRKETVRTVKAKKRPRDDVKNFKSIGSRARDHMKMLGKMWGKVNLDGADELMKEAVNLNISLANQDIKSAEASLAKIEELIKEATTPEGMQSASESLGTQQKDLSEYKKEIGRVKVEYLNRAHSQTKTDILTSIEKFEKGERLRQGEETVLRSKIGDELFNAEMAERYRQSEVFNVRQVQAVMLVVGDTFSVEKEKYIVIGKTDYAVQIKDIDNDKTFFLELQVMVPTDDGVLPKDYEPVFDGMPEASMPKGAMETGIDQVEHDKLLGELTPIEEVTEDDLFNIVKNSDYSLNINPNESLLNIKGVPGKPVAGKGWTPREYPGLNRNDTVMAPEALRIFVNVAKKFPKVWKFINPYVLGRFSVKSQVIKISDSLAANPVQLAKTLLHEIGHWEDHMPDISSRGNILGSVASLKNYAKHTLSKFDDDVDRSISQNTRAELRRDAIFEIAHELDITIKGNSPKGVSIQLAKALKDNPDAGTIQTLVSIRYGEKVEEYAAENGIITKKLIMNELKALSEWYDPYDPSANPAYTEYRNNPRELYAQVASAFINNERAVAVIAPNFYDAYRSYLNRKPRIEAEIIKLQGDISKTKEERLDKVLDDMGSGITGGEKKLSDILDDKDKIPNKRTISDALKKTFYSELYKIEDMSRKLGIGKSVINIVKESFYNVSMRQKNHTERITVNFLNKLYEYGIRYLDMSKYGKLKNIAERKAVVENPETGEIEVVDNLYIGELGITKDLANTLLNRLKERVGDEKFAQMEELSKEFSKIHLDLMKWAYKEGWFKQSVYNIIAVNPYYLRTSVVEYLKPSFRYSNKKLKGSFMPSLDPYTATLLSDLTLIRDLSLDIAKRGMVNQLLKPSAEISGEEMLPVKRDVAGKVIKKKYYGTLLYKEDGINKGYYVSPDIPLTLEYLTPEDRGELAQWWSMGTKGLRYSLTVLSPVFHIVNFVFRDLGMWMLASPSWTLPGAFTSALINYIAVFKDVAKELNLPNKFRRLARMKRVPSSKARSQLMIDAGHYGALNTGDLGIMHTGIEDDDAMMSIAKTIEELGFEPFREELQKLDILKWEDFKALSKDEAASLVDVINTLSTFEEAIPKLAAFRMMLKKGNYNKSQIAALIRVFFGSPEFKHRADLGILKDLTIFYNPFVRGTEAFIRLLLEEREKIEEEYATEGGDKAMRMVVPPMSSRAQAWSLTLQMMALPIMAVLALIGVFGEEMKRFYKGVRKFDLFHYAIVPIVKFDENGNSVYEKLPLPEGIRQINSVLFAIAYDLYLSPQSKIKAISEPFYHKLTGAFAEAATQVVNVYGLDTSINPAAESILSIYEHASGINHNDFFTGKSVLTPEEETILRNSASIFATKPELMINPDKIFSDPFLTQLAYIANKLTVNRSWYKARRNVTKDIAPASRIEDKLDKYPILRTIAKRFIGVGRADFNQDVWDIEKFNAAINAAKKLHSSRLEKKGIEEFKKNNPK